MSPFRFILLVGVFLFGYSAGPAQAQQPADPPAITDVAEDLLAAMRRAEAEQHAAAAAWASQRRLPLAIQQTDGRRTQLVGLLAGHPVYLTSLNRNAAHRTHTEVLYPGQALGLSLTGDGMEIGLWDGGVPLRSHQELVGRVDVLDASAEAEDHATHVAGTLAASGVRPEAQGMAYQARLRAYDWDDDTSEMADEAARGVLVTNHSYGIIAGWYYGDLEGSGDQWYWLGDPAISPAEDYIFGRYDVEAIQFDRVTFSHPFVLPVIAAGNDRGDDGPASGTYRALNRQGTWQSYPINSTTPLPDGGRDGFDSIAGAALAKNVLTIGSVGFAASGEPQASRFSSFGPTDDGRIKPDLVGNGERVFSSLAGSAFQYSLSSGTSMATPNVAGSLVLLQQHVFNQHGRHLRAATLKGLVLHTATDAGPAGPDYLYGWGLLNAEAAAGQVTEALANELAMREASLPNMASYTAAATVDEAGPLRVTLSWADLPGVRRPLNGAASLDDATPALRNDLDLRLVHDATGTTYLPYVLDPARPDAPAQAGDNTVDPVEQIFVPYAEAGAYTLFISHKATLASGNAQPFALFVSGARGALRPVSVSRLEVIEESIDRVDLAWRTPFERSAGTFRIQRAPVTYRAGAPREVGPFTLVGTLPVQGAAEQERAYTFGQVRVPAGSYLYRVFFANAETEYLAAEVEVSVPAPDAFAVLSNYPNPFRERSLLVLDLPAPQEVTLEVFDALGRRVARLLRGPLPAGRHEVAVEAAGWAPGIYLARLTTPDAARTHRLVLLR